MTALLHALPSPAPSFATVPVAGHPVLAARDGDEVRVPMKSFCGTLGLPWDGQRQRINRDEVLKAGASMMLAPSDGGPQAQLALPLGLLPGFLFGVDDRRLQPDVRDRVLAFKRECHDALHRHFFGRAATPALPTAQDLQAARQSATALIAAIAAETNPHVRRFLHQLLVADADQLGLAAPALEDLGQGRSAGARVEAVLEACKTLTARRVKWNHLHPRGAGGGRNVALCLPELARLFAVHDIDLGADVDLDAVFAQPTSSHRIYRRTVTSAFSRKATHCVLVEAWS